MAFRITPSLGQDAEQVESNSSSWNTPGGIPSPLLGNKFVGSDAHDYVLVVAGADIASAGTEVTINESTWVTTTAAGNWVTPVDGIKSGERFYARSKAIPV